MVAPVSLPDLSTLHDKFNYDVDTGILTHAKGYSSYVKAGQQAGYKRKDGYLQVKVSSRAYLLHRICYYMHTGVEPLFVDHINRVKDDNRFVNLKSVTHQQNMNNKSDYASNTTGKRNISYHVRDRVYEVKMKVNGKQIYIGRSQTLDGAEALLKSWKIGNNWHDTH